ncbi:MAG: ABC transporter permease [Acidobacteria bacterium]|nr:ABC transporter permease [Acidobacteriota bacterium]
MKALSQDLRYGIRMLLKKPGFTVVAVLTLALGLGANTAIFSAINALLVRPLPVEEAERLVAGFALREGFDPFGTSLLEYAAYREQAQTLAGSGIAGQRLFNLIGRDDEPERLQGAAVTADYLNTLGVKPILGRGFTAEEDGAGGPASALIGYQLWQRRFGGDRGFVGQPLNLEGRSYTVIGVLPPGFDLPNAAEVWVPLQVNIHTLPLDQRSASAYGMIARLKPGVSLQQADAELKGIARQLEQEYPQIRRGWSYKLIGLRQQLMGDLEGRIQQTLFALAAAVGFLLLICCANVAGLLLMRGVAREREIAIRLALGAGRRRVISQLLTESLLLALIGGLAGLMLAFWMAPLLSALNPIQAFSFATSLNDFRIDARVLSFSFVVSLLTGAVSGLIPALKAVGSNDLVTILKRGDQRSRGGAVSRRWLSALVVAETAVAVVLLVGGSLLLQSFQRLQQTELGFRPDNLLLMQMPLSTNKYSEHHQRAAFVEQTLERVKVLPGVVSAGITTNIPAQSGVTLDSVFVVEGRPPANPADVPITAHRLVSPDYLETLGVTLVKGRTINQQDTAQSQPVVVVSEELARQAWPGEDPLGKRIRRGRPHQTHFPWMTVVGVVKDTKEDRFNFRINRPAWYVPYTQLTGSPPVNLPLNLVVRTNGDPVSLTAAVRHAIRTVDPEQPIADVMTMQNHLADVLITERFSAVLMSTLAFLGLALASLGLYGVMAYSVSQRTGELGLRLALGARPRDILKLVFGQGLLLIVIGLSLGLLGAQALARLLSSTLYQTSPTDPATFALVSMVLIGVALLACYIPARRATKVDPMVALRYE